MAGYLAGATPTSAARQLLADMLAAIGTDPRFGGLARWTEPRRLDLRVGQAADIIAGCLLTIDIIYASALDETVPNDHILTAAGEILTAAGEALTW